MRWQSTCPGDARRHRLHPRLAILPRQRRASLPSNSLGDARAPDARVSPCGAGDSGVHVTGGSGTSGRSGAGQKEWGMAGRLWRIRRLGCHTAAARQIAGGHCEQGCGKCSRGSGTLGAGARTTTRRSPETLQEVRAQSTNSACGGCRRTAGNVCAGVPQGAPRPQCSGRVPGVCLCRYGIRSTRAPLLCCPLPHQGVRGAMGASPRSEHFESSFRYGPRYGMPHSGVPAWRRKPR